MPELPDITIYTEKLAERIVGRRLQRVRILNPFFLRTAIPPISIVEGKRVLGLRTLGKRIVIALEAELFMVLHLMIAGRLRWHALGSKAPGRIGLAMFDFEHGVLVITEAGTKRRASLALVQGEAALRALDPGGIDVFAASLTQFAERLRRENHTIKRALTDPHLFSGIGNAYSDEILHRARLSPVMLTHKMSDAEIERLFAATRATLSEWIERLRHEAGDDFPVGVTAFRPQMAVHGRFGKPCPVCGAPVQRIVYAENESNYCARCQTGGKLLADRALSRLLHESWPRSIDDT
jgi:formamidopyrimidine-DNA glycosylase